MAEFRIARAGADSYWQSFHSPSLHAMTVARRVGHPWHRYGVGI